MFNTASLGAFLRLTSRPLHWRHLSTSFNLNFVDFLSDNFAIDEGYYQNKSNHRKILDNIKLRQIEDNFPQLFQEEISKHDLSNRLIMAAKSLPNDTHPTWNTADLNLRIIDTLGEKPSFDFKPQRAETLLYEQNVAYFAGLDSGKLGIPGGRRAYVYVGQLARLARALSRWTLTQLTERFGFTPVVTPNLIYSDFIRACGFEPFGERTQVYSLEGEANTCLAGTAEMPLASLHFGHKFDSSDQLPRRYCALSRCYRAEAKAAGEMSGLYRVHYFDKVEMFALTECHSEASDQMLQELVSIQKYLFTQLGLHFQVVDMPPHELGLSAYRKFDIEAYMPGRDFWGEISSASNCTDYQSRRLNITYNKFHLEGEDLVDVSKHYVHTVNGTACAIPRVIIAIVEQNQTKHGKVTVPQVLRDYMKCDVI